MNKSAEFQKLNAEMQKKVDTLINESKMFWAFNREQLKEGMDKTPLKEGEKYVRVEGGGLMPEQNWDTFDKGMAEASDWFKREIKEKGLEEAHILYTLENHEAFYTGDIEDSYSLNGDLGSYYTREQVWEVFRKHQASHDDW